MNVFDLKSIVDEEVENIIREISTTGNVAGYSIPFAFDKTAKGKRFRKKNAEVFGMKKISDLDEDGE